MSRLHVVWDWNGTLLDDLPVIIEALNVGLGRLGLDPIDEHAYRDHFTRPVRGFYDSVFGRPVTDREWADLNETFHDEYYARAHAAPLTVDALDAVDHASGLGWTQSVLSMSAHHRLVEMVADHGLVDRFVLVEGLEAPTGETKAGHLEKHLAALERVGDEVVLVGDTPDDASAARTVGAEIVLYDGGSHHLPTLAATGAPVAHTLVQAMRMAERLALGEPVDSLW